MTSAEALDKLFEASKFEEILSKAKGIPQEDRTLDIDVIFARALRKLGKYQEGLNYIQQVHFKAEDEIANKINFLTIELDILTHMGDYENGEEKIPNILKLLEELDFESLNEKQKLDISQSYNELARINFFLSRFEQALDYMKNVYEIAKDLNNKQRMSSSLQNIGSTYVSIGEYILALDYFTRAIVIARELNIRHLIGHIEDIIGLVYFLQGRLEEALDSLELSLQIHKEVKDTRGMGFNYEYIGSVKLKQNLVEEALNNYKESYEIRKSLGNDTHTASTIFMLITTYLEIDDLSNAQLYLDELEELVKNTPTQRIIIQSQLAKAMYLKNTKLMRNKVKREQLFKEIINYPEITDFTFIVTSYLYLLDLMCEQIKELELSNETEITADVRELFLEIEKYTEAIGQIAMTKNLPDLKVSYFNIKGFIEISKFNNETASNNFTKAQKLCSKYGLTNVRFKFKEGLTSSDALNSVENHLVMNKEAFPYKIQKSLNKIIHSLPRLTIVTSLLKNVELTFTELQELTKMSPGNLGKHCDKLIDSGYLSKQKTIVGDKFLTVYTLTPEGLEEFKKYRELLVPFLSSA